MPDPLAIPSIPTDDLSPASGKEIAESLAYAMRYDARGKPVSGGWELAAKVAADRLVEHLGRSGFVVLKRRPRGPHSAG